MSANTIPIFAWPDSSDGRTLPIDPNDCARSINNMISEVSELTRKLGISVDLPTIERRSVICAQRYWANLFSSDHESSAEAAAALFIDLREIVECFPFAWFSMFHQAYRAGAITSAAWGLAARFIYTGTSGGPNYAGEFSARFLAGFREVSPGHMMNWAEKASWSALPDQVRIYRGAYVHSPNDAACGLSWALSRKYCDMHMNKRRINGGSHFYGAAQIEGRRTHLVSALIPREAIFSYVKIHDGSELIVDFERIDPSTIQLLPIQSPDALLKQLALFGRAGEGGINGIYRAMAGLHGIK